MKNVIVAVFALALITGCGSDDPGTPAVGGGNGGTGGSAGNGGPGGMGGGGGGAEDCDGQDNDGDGFVDEGLGARPCSTACGMGNEVCSQGSWGGRDAPPVVDEFCDAVDNDCDGNVDEGLPENVNGLRHGRESVAMATGSIDARLFSLKNAMAGITLRWQYR